MQVRRIAVVVCLLLGIAASAAARVPNDTHLGGRTDDGIVSRILTFVHLFDQFSIPPG